ncbi:hypothetical protein BDP27DRAFT_1433661 [Rhodocollybia butyracea]|uniref:Uncharacterized protein n=1 Tax=Rhodocollybia butyracea TaxID=206335 RepID=A0A9P5TX86_9AGAR|nr:hypothetical protein BDP27DRAFT_1433661 [Rhodocollybia butyracea]
MFIDIQESGGAQGLRVSTHARDVPLCFQNKPPVTPELVVVTSVIIDDCDVAVTSYHHHCRERSRTDQCYQLLADGASRERCTFSSSGLSPLTMRKSMMDEDAEDDLETGDSDAQVMDEVDAFLRGP